MSYDIHPGDCLLGPHDHHETTKENYQKSVHHKHNEHQDLPPSHHKQKPDTTSTKANIKNCPQNNAITRAAIASCP
jgi:hypothetical protein